MSTNGRTGTDRWLLGSVTDKVVRAATTPVLIIRSLGNEGIAEGAVLKGVLVPLDGSELAERVLPHVVDFAKPLGLSVSLVRVTPEPGAFFGYLHDSASVTEEMSLRVDAQAGEYLAEVGRKLRSQGVESVEERVLHGDPATAILEAGGEMQDVAVAMATHGMSGAGSWAIGAVTSRVVRYSTGPTLVVRADEDSSHLW
jgi:nucleotide-binding universal stress UspA family protein